MENKTFEEYLTIKYEFYNFWVSRKVEKKIKLFSEVWKWKDKKTYFPPTIWDIYHQQFDTPLFKKEFNEEFWDFAMLEPTEEIKEKMKDNIARQDEVMETIKLRNESYNYNCGLIKAWTWVWKSVLAIKITKYFQCNTLVLVSNVKLLKELVDRYYEFTWFQVAQYWGWKKEVDYITICTKTSFAKDYKEICWWEIKFETIIVDECHG